MIRKKYKKIKLFIIILILIFLLFVIPTIVLNKKIAIKKESTTFDKFLQTELKNSNKIYNVVDLVRYMQNERLSDNYNINSSENSSIVYNNKIIIKVLINNFKNSNTYYCNIINSDKQTKFNINSKEQSFEMNLVEGFNELDIELYENSEEIKSIKKIIYYIKPYEKQFLDELSKNGIAVHYGKDEEYEKSGELLKSLGVKYIRTDFFKYVINPSGDKYDYDAYDGWMKDINNTGIKVIGIIDGAYDVDSKINFENYINFFHNVEERYPQIEYFEIMNEPNYRYTTESGVEWYTKIVNTLEQNSKYNILNGGLALSENSTGNFLDSYQFYKLFNQYGGNKYNNTINFHLYDVGKIEETINSYKKVSREFGGFNKINVTEYGASTAETGEESQARTDVKDSIKYANCKGIKILYNLWSTKSENVWNHQLGILNNDYTPKLAYYSMKNFYENTNGAEYIGQIDLGDQIEAHVYDKDGKVKIIAWTKSKGITQKIKNDNFEVSDLYGNEINETENIIVSYDPIYLDTSSDKYFFQAISKSLTDGYKEFEESYSNEIKKISGLQEKINDLKNYSAELYDNESESDIIAESKMKDNFELGNLVLQAYKEDIIKDEAIIGGMLDLIDEIGDSFEDLVTVTAINRKTDLEEINDNINEAEKILEDNNNLEILYSNKILEYAKEFNNISQYILSINEENDIKTGLINSKAIHANELSKWSLEFSKLQIQKKLLPILSNIKNQYNNIIIQYPSLLENSEIKECYNNIIKFIDDYSYSLDSINNLNNLSLNLEKKIITKYIENTTEPINNSDIDILLNLEKVSSYYKDLLQYYLSDISIDYNNVKNSLNNAIDKYSNNKDIYNISFSYNLLIKATSIYNNELQNNDDYLNYLNVQRIYNIVDLSNYSIEKTIEVQEFIKKQKENICITYNTTNLTNNSVIANINLTENSSIQNNNGQSKYIFKENGKFNYIILTNDITYSVTASVKNIVKDYIIKNQNILLNNKNTIIKDFIKKINISNYKIVRDNIELSSDNKIATGDEIIYNNIHYKLIVSGDVNSDGDVTIHDLIKMRKILVDSKDIELTESEILAADTQQDNVVNIKDLINIRKIIVQ